MAGGDEAVSLRNRQIRVFKSVFRGELRSLVRSRSEVEVLVADATPCLKN
jgi:hypothetical protein